MRIVTRLVILLGLLAVVTDQVRAQDVGQPRQPARDEETWKQIAFRPPPALAGIVFDEKRPNVNYWEPWYLGWEPQRERKPGVPTENNPRTGPYRRLFEAGHDLHELHALMAPRPLLVSGGSEDPPERWKALNHSIAVNRLLGYENRVAMTNRPAHSPTEESNEQIYLFFEHFLKPADHSEER